MPDSGIKTKILTFGEMTPDGSLFAGADSEVALRAGCVMYSGQPLLVPKIRKILTGTTTGASGHIVNSVSGGYRRFFFNNAQPKIWQWVPSPASSTITDVSPAIATLENRQYTYYKFGTVYLCIPHSRGTAAVSLSMDETTGVRFEAMIPAGTQVLGPHVGRVRSHLIIAGGWDSVSGVGLNRWNWSARADHTLWTYNSNEAGFAEITAEPQGNEIIGLVTWNDFAIFFTRTALVRVGYQGGAEKWDPQQIGQAHQTLFGLPVVKAGRDCYYIGVDGPRAIFNGEESVPIASGKVARQLMDRTVSEWAVESLKGGGYDKSCGLCWWVYASVDGQWRMLIYHLESQEFTFLDLGSATTNEWGASGSFDEFVSAGAKISSTNLGTSAFFDQVKPLSSLVLVPSETEAAGDWRLWAQHMNEAGGNVQHDTYAVTHLTKNVRLSQFKSEIISVRPLWRTNAAGEGINLAVQIEFSDTPMMKSTEYGVTTPLVVSTANADSASRVRDLLPGANGFFHRFKVTFPEISEVVTKGDPLSDYQKLEELSGIEVQYRESGEHSF